MGEGHLNFAEGVVQCGLYSETTTFFPCGNVCSRAL